MTLHDLIKQVSEIIIPGTDAFYNYILYTSDDNGGFLRTRWCWWDKPLENHKLSDNYEVVMVTSRSLIDVKDLEKRDDTYLKLQFHYDFKHAVPEDADWDLGLLYNYVYLVDLKAKTYMIVYRLAEY